MKEYGVFEFGNDEFLFIEKTEAKEYGLREISEAEQKDISFLVSDDYISFFSNCTTDCVGKYTGFIGCWDYPEIMESFKKKVIRAHASLYNFLMNSKKLVWAEMRDKYFGGKAYVYPDEMIENLNKFDNKEIIAFLHYCTVYKERFCTGAYGEYAKDGFIIKLLLRLKKLPLSL